MERRLILASASPRRRELLAELYPFFEVEPSAFEESAEGLSAPDTALCFAEGKAREVFSRFPDSIVLGADTVVSYGGEILGKPKTPPDAERILRMLSGKTHSVYTGVCLIGQGMFWKGVEETRVTFNELSEALIETYVKSGLPMDKAGAYGIQDGYPLVKEYQGSYSNVVGLPKELVRAFLKEGNIC